ATEGRFALKHGKSSLVRQLLGSHASRGWHRRAPGHHARPPSLLALGWWSSMKYKRHWLALALVFFSSFAILLSQGVKLHRSLPPIPELVVDTTGAPLFTRESIHQGQNVWQ